MKKKGIWIILLVILGVAGYFIYDSMSGTKPPVEDGDGNRDAPALISYSIRDTFSHDTSYYTQGLTIYKGFLYQGTGLEGKSKLIKTPVADIKTGKPAKEIKLDSTIFGEGVTVVRDTIYQLTYKNGLLFVYDLNLKKIREVPLVTDTKEGWGITTDGSQLIITDGGGNLYFYEPSTMKLLRTQQVSESGSLSYNLNELEYIDGFIYANQYQSPYILKIDPANGKVVGKMDFSEVVRNIKSRKPDADVLNGIAYDPDTKKIYVTGKLWPELYEIQLGQ